MKRKGNSGPVVNRGRCPFCQHGWDARDEDGYCMAWVKGGKRCGCVQRPADEPPKPRKP
jgi:hypothetical protein